MTLLHIAGKLQCLLTQNAIYLSPFLQLQYLYALSFASCQVFGSERWHPDMQFAWVMVPIPPSRPDSGSGRTS